jgi:PAS domain S-box-containing protein
MADQSKFSETMRIDISPDLLRDHTSPEGKQSVVVSPSGRRENPSPDQRPPESEYEDLLQALYDAALVTGLDGRILGANVRAVDFLQHDRSVLCEMSVLEIISGASHALIDTLLENLRDERFTLIQAYCVRKDGSIFAAEIAVNKLSFGEERLCFFIRDITLRRQAEEMLRTEHNAIQNAGNGIAITDLDGKIEYLNPALLTMWNSSEAVQLMGTNIRDLWADAISAQELIDLIMAGDGAWTSEMTRSDTDGSSGEMQVSAACNRDSDNNQVGMVFSFTDLSDRKRAEEAERDGERNRVMLESLGAACHHLGQPATVLLANMGFIQKHLDGASNNDLAEVVGSSMEAAETLAGILHRLNAVNEYRTTQYLEASDAGDGVESRILDIGG